jgi:hypothetical protein
MRFYVLSTACPWQALPKDLPPKSTAHYYFTLWTGRYAGTHPPRALPGYARARRTRGEPQGSHHRQLERHGGSKEGSTLDPQGYDAGKKVTGR